MDILQQYSQFVGKSGLVRTVQESTELRLAEQYAALNDELSKLRMSTLGAVHVAADVCFGFPFCRVDGTQQRIVELERQLEQLVKMQTDRRTPGQVPCQFRSRTTRKGIREPVHPGW